MLRTAIANVRRSETPTRRSGKSVPLLVTARLPKINVQIPPKKWEVVIAVTASGEARCRNSYAAFGTFVWFYPLMADIPYVGFLAQRLQKGE